MKTILQASMAFSLASVICLSCGSSALAGRPGGGGSGTPPDIQVAYRLPDGKGVKLVVSNENGANQMTLYKSSTSFRFDLAPRGQQQIAIVDGSTRRLKLLDYSVSSGVYVPGTITDLGEAATSGAVDFSPDGTKIAYACCGSSSDQLVVLDLGTGDKTVWAQGNYFWDIAWFRGGSSIAYSTLIPLEVREVIAPMAAPELLYTGSAGQLDIDSARTNPNQLVISNNDSGSGVIGLWEAGTGFVDSNLANSTKSWQGTLNCDDTKLAYMGVQNNSGSQAFYVLDRNTGINTLVSKSSNILLQFWPTCN